MAIATMPPTIADLLESLGGIPARRVLFNPVPGTATERDVVDLHERHNRRYELVNATVVEKAIGFDESFFALFLSVALVDYLRTHDLGKPVGNGAMMRLFAGLVRVPDVAFISWERYPRKKRRRGEIPTLAPDLVVEVLRKDNTPKEMARKLREYFEAGVRLVWYVDPSKRTVTRLHGRGSLDPAHRGPDPRRRRCAAGLLAVDPRLVRRGRAHRAAAAVATKSLRIRRHRFSL